jgi:branched-chain amino acid transport system ATP-binding protein
MTDTAAGGRDEDRTEQVMAAVDAEQALREGALAAEGEAMLAVDPEFVPRGRLDPRRITEGAPLFPLFVLFGLNAVEELDRVAFGVLIPEIRDHFGLSNQGILTVVALSLPISLLMGVPIAYYADRSKRTRIAAAGATVWAGFTFMTGLAANVWMLTTARAGSALGKAVNDPTHNSLLPDYYPLRIRAKVFSAYRAAVSVGLFVGPLAAGTLAYFWGWRAPFIVFVVPSLIFAFLATRLKEPVRGNMDRREQGADEELANIAERAGSFGESWRHVFAIPTLRRLYVSIPFLSAAIIGLASLLSLFYEEVFELSDIQRGFVFASEEPFQILGFIVVTPIIQRMLNKDPGKVMTALAYGAVGISVFLVLQALAPTLWMAIGLGWIRAFIGAVVTPGIAAVLSLVIPPKVRALGFTVFSLFVLLGIPALPVAGAIGDRWGIRVGIIAMVPIFLIGAFILASSGSLVAADMKRVRAATLTQAEARQARLKGDPKILLCRGIDVAYGQTQVLFDVDFSVDDGEIVALLGTNGAGKSTLLNAISGLVEPRAGAIVYDGHDITMSDANTTCAEGIVLVPGGKGVFPTLTVAENIDLAGWLYRKDPEELARSVEQVLEYFPLLRERWDQKAGNLSGGEQQMLTLGQAFIARPKLLMIDELSLGLAPVIVEQLLEIVRAIHAQGTTIILVEQSVNVAITLAQRAVFMEKGEVRFDGPTAELLDRPEILRAVFLQGAGAHTGNGTDGDDNGSASPARTKPRAPFTPHCDSCGSDHGIALETAGLTVSFGGVRAVTDVDLSVHQGQILGLIGPNGAGKTTIFDLISGFVAPTAGRVRLQGEDVTDLTPDLRAVRGLGRSFQDARLFSAMTVRQTISVAFERHIKTRDAVAAALMSPATRSSERLLAEEVDRLIEIMNLEAFADKFVGELSTGSRRVVDIACSMAHDPKVLLLDEPSSGIAQRETEALGPLLLSIRERTGAALIVIEHDMPLIRSISDELIALETGMVIARGEPDDVINDPRVIEGYLGGHEIVINRSGQEGEAKVLSAGGVGAAPPAAMAVPPLRRRSAPLQARGRS